MRGWYLEFTGAELTKVFGGLGTDIGPELHLYATGMDIADRNIEEYYGVGGIHCAEQAKDGSEGGRGAVQGGDIVSRDHGDRAVALRGVLRCRRGMYTQHEYMRWHFTGKVKIEAGELDGYEWIRCHKGREIREESKDEAAP